MDFQFCFDFDAPSKEASTAAPPREYLAATWVSKEREPSTGTKHVLVEKLNLNGLTLFRRHVKDVEFELADRDISTGAIVQAIHAKSDLIPAVYEGGLKTWECSLDLVSFLHESVGATTIRGRVLELGCGAGLPGVYCLGLPNVTRVDFQDYNEEVLRMVTIPNALVNASKYRPEESADNGCQGCLEQEVGYDSMPDTLGNLWAGDWSTLAEAVYAREAERQNFRYDVILSSETIYHRASYPKLRAVLLQLLARDGVAWIAGKSYYFGCGGSMAEFVEYLEASGEFVCASAMRTTEEGGASAVHREIIQIRWK